MVSDRINLRSDAGDSTANFPSELGSNALLSPQSLREIRQNYGSVVAADVTSAVLNNGFSLVDTNNRLPETAGARVAVGKIGQAADNVSAGEREKPREAPAPRDSMNENERKMSDTWNKVLDNVMKGPLGVLLKQLAPVLKELGNQLATGHFDFPKLGELVKDIHIDREQMDAIAQELNKFGQLLKEKLGIDVQVKFGRQNGKVGVKNINIAEAGGTHNFNASLNIPVEGTPQAGETLEAGFTGPSYNSLDVNTAIQRLHDRAIRFDKQ